MSEKKSAKVVGKFNGVEIVLEKGKLAHQADSSVVATMGGTTVLAAVTSMPAREDGDFFPLRVDYEERYYAGGLISGSRFTRREGRPTDAAIVEGRLIDHAIRPLFPKDFMDEVQLVVTVFSVDHKVNPLLLGFIAASAAFSTSGLPFNGPIVPLRIEHKDGKHNFSLNDQDESADLNAIVSYLENGEKVQAIEADADIISEDIVLKGIKEGGKAVKPLFELLEKFEKEVNIEKKDYEKSWINKEAIKELHSIVLPKLGEKYKKGVKFESHEWMEAIAEALKEVSKIEEEKEDGLSKGQIEVLIGEAQKDFVRNLVLKDGKRLDRREMDEIRPLEAEVEVIPRVHGSGLFTRGKTQSLSIATLGTEKDSLLVQTMHGEKEKTYIHHYNFPPYSTGEVGRVGGAGRRDIGHGILAEKALIPVLPSGDDFPYAIRVVSEILSSNGSTSMAATCASSLSLMDAGVPIKSHVGGIGVGLFVDKDIKDPKISDYKLLTDIVGYEDYSGYMDFKMTGTREGMTAIQLELKVMGIPLDLLDSIFETSKSARMKVLDVMDKAIPAPRETVGEFAPKFEILTIDNDKVGTVIGSGGNMIKSITAKFGVEINIEEYPDHADVVISAIDRQQVVDAKDYVLDLVTPVEVGEVYDGKVVRIEEYGAFIELGPNKDGLLHVSEISNDFVDNVNDHLSMGQEVKVKVIGMDRGKVSLSMKALQEKPESRY